MKARNKVLIYGLASVVMVGLIVHETGLLEERFGPGHPPERSRAESPIPTEETAAVETIEVEVVRTAVGTVAARSLVAVSPRVMATVLEIAPVEGDEVAAGDLIARLDDRDLSAAAAAAEAGESAARAQVEAARAQVASARAENVRAAAERERVERLFEREAATQRGLDAARSAAQAAGAQVEAAEASLAAAQAAAAAASESANGARVALGFAAVHAPSNGVVASRAIEPGELAVPGRPLVTLYDAGDLRFEAAVPEGDARGLAVGSTVRIEIPALELALDAPVETIEPRADPASRTVAVRAALPAHPGLVAGQFGRLAYPLETRTALAIPASAVARTGQVELVRVVAGDGRARARNVRTGRALGSGRVEVLSGLAEGERVLAEAR